MCGVDAAALCASCASTPLSLTPTTSCPARSSACPTKAQAICWLAHRPPPSWPRRRERCRRQYQRIAPFYRRRSALQFLACPSLWPPQRQVPSRRRPSCPTKLRFKGRCQAPKRLALQEQPTPPLHPPAPASRHCQDQPECPWCRRALARRPPPRLPKCPGRGVLVNLGQRALASPGQRARRALVNLEQRALVQRGGQGAAPGAPHPGDLFGVALGCGGP